MKSCRAPRGAAHQSDDHPRQGQPIDQYGSGGEGKQRGQYGDKADDPAEREQGRGAKFTNTPYSTEAATAAAAAAANNAYPPKPIRTSRPPSLIMTEISSRSLVMINAIRATSALIPTVSFLVGVAPAWCRRPIDHQRRRSPTTSTDQLAAR